MYHLIPISKLLIILVILFICITPSYSQRVNNDTEGSQNNLAREKGEDDKSLAMKIKLASDIQGLNDYLKDVTGELAVARAQAHIASAAWYVDRPWAKKLLLEAYKLTLPDEEERKKLRERKLGYDPKEPRQIDFAKGSLRGYIFTIARRSSDFARELSNLAKDELGKMEELNINFGLASGALRENDLAGASKYINQAFTVDPTQTLPLSLIKELKYKDNALADNLLLQYINTINGQRLSRGGLVRTYFILEYLIFPNPYLDPKPHPQINPAVIKAYLHYMVRSAYEIEQRDPNSIVELRGWLRKIWHPLQQYAPELLGDFAFLQKKGQPQGDAPLPTVSEKEELEANIKKRTEDAIKSRNPETLGREINNAAIRGDFEKAHEMLDLIEDKKAREKYMQELNWREALDFIKKGKLLEAEQLARQLTKADFILRVYPMLTKAILNQDKSRGIILIDDVVTRLKESDSPNQCLRFISEIIHPMAAIDQAHALELLDKMVSQANAVKIENSFGAVDIPTSIFTDLAKTYPAQVRQAAHFLKNPLQKIAVLSEIYRSELEALLEEQKKEKKATP